MSTGFNRGSGGTTAGLVERRAGVETRICSCVVNGHDRDTLDPDYTAHRQRFLAEQGYAYTIVDADDVLSG